MHVSVASIVVRAAALTGWIAIVGNCCLSAADPGARLWAEFSRACHDLDREAGGIWDRR
jgi:hypothetical protein